MGYYTPVTIMILVVSALSRKYMAQSIIFALWMTEYRNEQEIFLVSLVYLASIILASFASE